MASSDGLDFRDARVRLHDGRAKHRAAGKGTGTVSPLPNQCVPCASARARHAAPLRRSAGAILIAGRHFVTVWRANRMPRVARVRVSAADTVASEMQA
ncbi:hypothetical protein AQ611_12435 [Burkholderia singularis]|nr:hypothetical protein AQ611_12435 [Burkholderia sp. Bp7605]